MTFCKNWKKWIAFTTLTLGCLIGRPLYTYATAGQQLEQAQRDKAKAENGLEKANDSIQDLQTDRASLQSYLDNLNEELQKANSKLLEIDEIIEKKQNAITEAQETIADAKEQQKVRYEEMKQRIQFLYEEGNTSYLDVFLSASSFSDLLNKADYIEMINQYDRKMLQEYADTQVKIAKKEKELKQDKETLEMLQQEANASTTGLYEDVKKTSENVRQYLDQIAEKEEEALAYEQEIAQKESDIATLQEQYKEELAMSLQSQAMVNRDLSDVLFASGDVDLMAAIIECEAGGESYTGKVAVGAVVLNRVRSPLFPSTVLEVIMQKKQFSPVGSGRFALVLARGANESCYQAAQDAMAGASPVGNCLFFRTPIPGLTVQQIGGHIFY